MKQQSKKDKIIIITGAANGIGRAMAIRFAAQGAKKIICADLDENGVRETAKQIDGVAHKLDVSREADISALIEATETDVGPIDLYCSNAGISIAGGVEVDDEGWQCHSVHLPLPEDRCIHPPGGLDRSFIS